MEAASEEFQIGLRYIFAARRLGDEALRCPREEIGTLLHAAKDFRAEGVRMMVGDCVTGENTQPPFTCPAKSPGHGRDDSTSLGG